MVPYIWICNLVRQFTIKVFIPCQYWWSWLILSVWLWSSHNYQTIQYCNHTRISIFKSYVWSD